MGVINKLNFIKEALINAPPLINIRKHEFNKYFETAENVNLFRGVYDSYQEALSHSPSTKVIGYDNKVAADMYKDRIGRINTYDYPVLFWLEKILHNDNNSLFDFGGHIGLSYYSFVQYLSIKSITWKVYDLDEVVNAGIEFAKNHDESHRLSFTKHLSDAESHDIFFASGSLQYLEGNLSDVLSELSSFPKHIIVNMLPAYDGASFYTVQNIGTAYCPYQVFNNDIFINSILDKGYKLLDEWRNDDKSCYIAFEEEHSLDHYKGYIFEQI